MQEYQLNKSIVSTSKSSQELKDTPASISVITKEQLEAKPVNDIGQAVSLVPGVSIDMDRGQNGAYPISIRGMPAGYTLILIDGKRQDVSAGAFPNAYSDWIFSGFLPPVAMIERIEVIRGPMSTLYGSDAIGGVINIITKKNLQEWGSSFLVETTIEEQKYFGNIYSGNFYARNGMVSRICAL
ncbi:TonB-dependent receptor plug domain-containing protein [Helicobacter sp. 12S02232-10]|uniref:TonB-dependent receptor plug domain-containing protein n=1 Tax=Helicobacter sp. 12S02232-10 TaxID=1476197 RepID=UPI002150775E|nr:TonB-dependent receptor plug domain-containing protein [Helicobacter sp. 12S02232-10]